MSSLWKPRSTTVLVKQDFKTGRTGRTARRIESTRSSLAASGRFKWTIEAGQRRLILEGVGGWCEGLSDIDGSPEVIAAP